MRLGMWFTNILFRCPHGLTVGLPPLVRFLPRRFSELAADVASILFNYFTVTTLDDVQGAEDEAGLLKSADAIKALVDAEIDGSASGLNGQGVASERVVGE